MESLHPDFATERAQPDASRLELWEIFASDETEFTPDKALYYWGNAAFTWQGNYYERRVLRRGDVRRYLDKQKNSVSLTLSNIDLALSVISETETLEGMWAQCRVISHWRQGDSYIRFAGRLTEPDELDGQTCRISVDQDFGGDEAQIPAFKMDLLCAHATDFKGEACRGGAPLASKLPIYQQARECSGTPRQCSEYGNLANIHAFSIRPVQGTFGYQVVEPRRLLGFLPFGKKKRNVSAPWSSVSDINADTAIPEVAGTIQCEGIPVIHADTGTNIKFLSIFAGDHSEGFYNFRITDKEYLPLPFVDIGTGQPTLRTALGLYGSEGQPASLQFPGAGNFSGVTWAEGQAVGSDPADANDSSPTAVAVIRGRNNFDLPDAGGQFTVKGWTDCGVYMLRWYLINRARILPSQIDDESFLTEGLKTFAPVLDDTGFEQSVIPTTVTGGVDFRAYASASGYGAATIDKILLLMAQGKPVIGGYGALVQAYYRYINQQQPPTFIAGFRRVARRYTTNFRLAEQMPLRDFLWDILLPSFNGQLIYSPAGKVQVRVDSPVDQAYLTAANAVDDLSLQVSNVRMWQQNETELLLIGAHQQNAELRRVVAAEYTDPVTPITVTRTQTGSLTVTLSAATLIGATANSPAAVTVTLGGTVTAGAQLELIVDDWIVTHTAGANDDITAIAGLLAAQVNGHPRLKYVRAAWTGDSTIRLEALHGRLTFDYALTHVHQAGDEVMRVAAAFGGDSPYDQKIGNDSFKFPLGSRQSSTNQLKGKFRSIVNDWAEIPVVRNYEAHQKLIRKTKPEELNLSAVDTLHQASRLLKLRGGKRRLGNWFCTLATLGTAELLNVGQVVVVSHYSGHGYIRFRPVTIEELTVTPENQVKIIGRRYRTEIYDDAINEHGPITLLPIQAGAANNTDTPPPPPPPPPYDPYDPNNPLIQQ